MDKKTLNKIAVIGICMFVLQGYAFKGGYILPILFSRIRAVFIVQKILAPIFIIFFIYMAISNRMNNLADFVILFLAIYYTFAYQDGYFIKLDIWAKFLFFVCYPVVYILKSYLFLKYKKLDKQSYEYGLYIGITIFTMLLFGWIYITRVSASFL